MMFEHISKHRGESSKHEMQQSIFDELLEVFGNMVKHCLACLIFKKSMLMKIRNPFFKLLDNSSLGFYFLLTCSLSLDWVL